MPEFVCRLGAPDGSVVEQRRVAASLDSLRRELEGEGFHIFSLAAARSRFRIAVLLAIGEGHRPGLPALQHPAHDPAPRRSAARPVARAAQATSRPTRTFRALLEKVHQQVTTGVSLCPMPFCPSVTSFRGSTPTPCGPANASGELEQVIGRFVEYQRLVESVRKKIIGALTYPAVLVTLAIVSGRSSSWSR